VGVARVPNVGDVDTWVMMLGPSFGKTIVKTFNGPALEDAWDITGLH